MKKRTPWILGGIALIAIGIGITVASQTDGDRKPIAAAQAIARIHARNVKLQTILLLLMRPKVRRVGGRSSGTRKATEVLRRAEGIGGRRDGISGRTAGRGRK